MVKVLGFFNLFFSILELHGLYKYTEILKEKFQAEGFSLLTANPYEIYIYPLLLLVIGIISFIIGIVNLGGMRVKTRRQEFLHIMLGALVIFSSTIIFWDLIVG